VDNRLERLREKLEEMKLDAFLVSTPENRRYLSRFSGSAGNLLISKDQAILATDFRYIEQAQKQTSGFDIVQVTPGWSWLLDQMSKVGVTKVGYESHNMTVSSYKTITDSIKQLPSATRLKYSLVGTNGVVEALRSVKDSNELSLLQKAIDISDKAMEAITPTIKAGEEEREVAWRLEKAMREFGADSLSFDTIVASGPNGAMPHHRPSNRAIQAGEPVVIDMGAKLGGYCSDITRTIYIGEPDETYRKVYDLVLGAQLTAITTLMPKMNGGEGDGLARDLLDQAGYRDNFGHSLGHGIGLAVHEYPGIGPNSSNVLEEGMVFSVEPGIYLSGWGGVRIEDLVVLRSDGASPLSKAKK